MFLIFSVAFFILVYAKEAERLWVESGKQMCKEDKARLLDESLVCRQQRDVAVKEMERLKEKIQKRLDKRNSLPLKSRP